MDDSSMFGRTLTIKEAKTEIKRLENELDLYATKRNINFNKTQPGAIKIKDIIVDSTHTNVDSFLNYVSRDIEYDTKIFELLTCIYTYKLYIAKELKILSEDDEVGYIRYLREEENKSWREIDNMLHRGYDYSRTKLKRARAKNRVNSK